MVSVSNTPENENDVFTTLDELSDIVMTFLQEFEFRRGFQYPAPWIDRNYIRSRRELLEHLQALPRSDEDPLSRQIGGIEEALPESLRAWAERHRTALELLPDETVLSLHGVFLGVQENVVELVDIAYRGVVDVTPGEQPAPPAAGIPLELQGRDRLYLSRWLEGDSSEDIAKFLNVTVPAVNNRIYNLRKQYGEDVVPRSRSRKRRPN